MANSWFRFYAEFEDDPKVQMMPENMQRRLAMLFCERCKEEKRTEAQRAFKWHISMSDLSETKTLFLELGFIDDKWVVLNWDKRQFTAEQRQQKRHADKRQGSGLPRRRWINPHVRERVMDRDGRACVYCNSCVNLTLDHVVSELRGGGNDEQNLVVACRPCNARKREFTLEQAQMSYREGYTPPCQHLARPIANLPLARTDTDTDTDSDTEQKQRKAVARGTRLPADFSPNESHETIASERNLSLEGELAAFRDYWNGISGQKGTKLDWAGAFRNWLRSSRNGNKNGSKPKTKWVTGNPDNPDDWAAATHPDWEAAQ